MHNSIHLSKNLSKSQENVQFLFSGCVNYINFQRSHGLPFNSWFLGWHNLFSRAKGWEISKMCPIQLYRKLTLIFPHSKLMRLILDWFPSYPKNYTILVISLDNHRILRVLNLLPRLCCVEYALFRRKYMIRL